MADVLTVLFQVVLCLTAITLGAWTLHPALVWAFGGRR